jgi:D-beta-D-heptose 7-phosphate kinase/D-beta-D-heptose 1-phosphate adenosyltransferase
VIGDLILDRFVRGEVNRFSPEEVACPVLDCSEEQCFLGGAANVAANLFALGANVTLAGLTGLDQSAEGISFLLANMWTRAPERFSKAIFPVEGRPTTTKTRFVANERHLLRTDKESREPASVQELKGIVQYTEQWAKGGNGGIIIQDYAKGVVTEFLITEVMRIAQKEEIPVFVDPKEAHWKLFKGAELVKPNVKEALSAFGVRDHDPYGDILNWGRSVLTFTGAKAVIITRGADGMSLFTKTEGGAWVLPQPVEVEDVSGAGDTSIAILALARLAGADWKDAMAWANTGAGIVIGKRGTSVIQLDELLAKFPQRS